MENELNQGYIELFISNIMGPLGGIFALGVVFGVGISYMVGRKHMKSQIDVKVEAVTSKLVGKMDSLTKEVQALEERLRPYLEFEKEVIKKKLNQAADTGTHEVLKP